MACIRGVDWLDYFRGLSDEEAYRLALWLAAEGLTLGEFVEIVDRAYPVAPVEWHDRPRVFVTRVGRRVAAAYARRKRWFTCRAIAFEDAMVSGALPGDVASEELWISGLPAPPPRIEELFRTLQRVPHGRG